MVKVYVHTHFMHDESFVFGVYANLDDAIGATGCHPHSDGVWVNSYPGGSDRIEEHEVLDAHRVDAA